MDVVAERDDNVGHYRVAAGHVFGDASLYLTAGPVGPRLCHDKGECGDCQTKHERVDRCLTSGISGERSESAECRG